MRGKLDEAGFIVEKTNVSRLLDRHALGKIVALVAVVAILLVVFLDKQHRPDFSDFKVYWLAGTKAAAHQTVYDVQGHYQFKYSPFVALLWSVPGALLHAKRQHWAWLHYAATGGGLVLMWLGLARILAPGRAFWLWLAVLLVFGVGLRDELKLGQENLWPIVLVLPAWFLGRRASGARGFDAAAFASGVAWAIAVQWKLYALVLAPLWLLRGRWQVWLGAAAATLFTLFGVQALVHGPEFALAENGRWLQSLSASSEELLVSQYNVSALGILGKWGQHFGLSFGAWAYALWFGLGLAWAAVLLWAEREAKRRDAPYLHFWSASWAWCGVLVLNPLVWPYWLLLCVPLFLAYITEASWRVRDWALWLVLALFASANWLQNQPIVHAGGSFVAVLIWLYDAQRRARSRDQHQLEQLRELPLSLAWPELSARRG